MNNKFSEELVFATTISASLDLIVSEMLVSSSNFISITWSEVDFDILLLLTLIVTICYLLLFLNYKLYHLFNISLVWVKQGMSMALGN